MYAKFGILKYNVQLGSYTASREELQQILATPLVEGDPRLKIRGLEILGTIELNQNTSAALNDWTDLLATAKAIGHAKWENRANGYLGIVAGINGDVAGELTFGIWLANGMSTNGMGDGAVRIIGRVEALAKKNGYTEMPLQFSIAKVRALFASGNAQGFAEAKALLQATLADARREGILGAQTDLLSQAGQLAVIESDYAGAEKSFAEQVQVAKQASLPSMRADGLLHLSQIYRIQREGDKAELAIDPGIDAVRGVQESYDLPRFFAEKLSARPKSLGRKFRRRPANPEIFHIPARSLQHSNARFFAQVRAELTRQFVYHWSSDFRRSPFIVQHASSELSRLVATGATPRSIHPK